MTRVLIAFDGSSAAHAAIGTAAALFPGAETTVATVHPPAPSAEVGALAALRCPTA